MIAELIIVTSWIVGEAVLGRSRTCGRGFLFFCFWCPRVLQGVLNMLAIDGQSSVVAAAMLYMSLWSVFFPCVVNCTEHWFGGGTHR